jgi:probable rRNA maturation factor
VVEIHILTHDAHWQGLGATVKRAAQAVFLELASQKKSKLSGHKKLDASLRWHDNPSVTILLTNDAEVRAFNRDFRGKDKPTNVLSFCGSEVEGGTHLGDVALAYETIAREAGEQGKSLKAHVAHLTVHGMLHLLGHDHARAAEAKAMEALEIRILNTLGIANPYESL